MGGCRKAKQGQKRARPPCETMGVGPEFVLVLPKRDFLSAHPHAVNWMKSIALALARRGELVQALYAG